MSYLDQEIRQLIARGQKIEAIKNVMQSTGKGLKEAKEYVDNLAKASPSMPPPMVSEETLKFEAGELVRRGRKIEAVKKVRDLTGWGLKRSKEFVDSITV